jgi:signal transduction histidine kinase
VKKNALYIVVGIISILLLLDIFLTRHNNEIIQSNKDLQARTNKIKVYYDQVGKLIIHSLDLGLRGYAIVREPKLILPFNNAISWHDSLLTNVEEPLRKLNYNFAQYNVFKDSLDSYFKYCIYMKELLDKGDEETFKRVFRKDRGGSLWAEYLKGEQSINEFVEATNIDAQNKYEAAMSQNHVLQVVLFIICFPTLLYTAIYTVRTFKLLDLLRRAELDKNKMLTEQNATLEQFGYITAHNLRAPLARIMGLGSIIKITEDDKERGIVIEKLLSSTRDLDQVIKDLNTILDIRRHSSNMIAVNVLQSIQRTFSMLEKERIEKDVRFNTSVNKDLSVLVVPAYIDSVLYNLVSNAIKYREPSRQPVIEISAKIFESETLIKITDNGLGMDLQAVRNDLFGLYKRFHTHVEGRGIGLYLVKTQVEAMGGRLDVESELDKGTTFLIYLRSGESLDPVADVDDES